MSAKPTPGSWKVVSGLTVVADDGSYICRVAGPSEKDPESLANAHLVAAAPELLAALEQQIGPRRNQKNLKCHVGICHETECERCSWERKAWDAIAKAKGESP